MIWDIKQECKNKLPWIIVTPYRMEFERVCARMNLHHREARWIYSIERFYGLRVNKDKVLICHGAEKIPGYERLHAEIAIRSKL